MKPLKIFTVDAFTNTAFKGNAAAVCITDEELPENTMQLIAMEIGFSETAFVKQEGDLFKIRYFSPKKEIPLCGHATLAAAKVIAGQLNSTEVNFVTGGGIALQTVVQQNEITMQFPVYNVTPVEITTAMQQALGLTAFTASCFSANNKIIMIEIESAEVLAKLAPDFTALVASHNNINGVLVTAASSNQEYDYEYRYFWPWAGTNEDPVTGGVQTFLAKYWSGKLNKNEMTAFQSSQRTGSMKVALQNDKVFITGEAVIMMEGNLINY